MQLFSSGLYANVITDTEGLLTMKTGSSKPVRCAIYTRVSTDQGLEQDRPVLQRLLGDVR